MIGEWLRYLRVNKILKVIIGIGWMRIMVKKVGFLIEKGYGYLKGEEENIVKFIYLLVFMKNGKSIVYLEKD